MDPQMTALLTERLTERAADDPIAAMLLAKLSEQNDEPPREDDVAALERKLERAGRFIERMRDELTAANTLAAHVAGLLGACSACWGLDGLCPRCGGTGDPGSRMPQVDALVDWVSPALARAGLGIVSLTSTTRTATADAGQRVRSNDGVI